MPSYKTHAIHGEVILPEIEKRTDIKCNDFKTFCFGPDALTATHYKMFSYQHRNCVKEFFEAMMNYIIENKLQDNSEVMAFLYGQLDHYIVDIVCHPIIYYMTEGLTKKHKVDPHGLVEMWIDNYIMQKYGKNEKFYFHKWYLKDKELRDLVNTIYKGVYNASHESIRYSVGISFMNLFDSLARTNAIGVSPLILKMFNIGDLTFKDVERVIPYLNLDHNIWTHPITGEELTLSFDDLWDKSSEKSLEAIHDINKHVYDGKPLTQNYIITDSSYDTGFPCPEKKEIQFVKKYK